MKKLFFLFSLIAFVVAFAPEAKGQTKDFASSYSLASDTVTNTGTSYLQVNVRGEHVPYTTIQVNVTKISGTVGGTISLQGSIDGTNYKALNTVETQTALATITAADASGVYHWRLTGNPFPYYRVSWTGTGTMAASFTAKIHQPKER